MNDKLTFENIMVFYENLDEQSKIVSIFTTILIFFLTIGFIWYFKIRKPSSKKYVLLVGTSNCGKTNIYSQLVFKRTLLTQTSITPNIGEVTIEKTGSHKEKKLEIADLPGHDKVRIRFFNLFKRSARAIVLVIDSSTFTKESKDVAQFLYEILTDDTLTRLKLRILIACNKQDIEFVKGEQFIRVNLEKEIELLHKISSSALKSTSDSSSKSNKANKLCTNDDKAFEFKDLKNFKVDFCEMNSLSNEGVAPLRDWLGSKSF